MKLIRFLLPLLLLAPCAGNAFAAEAAPLDPAQEQFFSQFRTAIMGENVPQLMHLTHSQALACIKEEQQEEYYGLTMKNLVEILGRKQIIQEIKSRKVNEADLKISDDPATQNRIKWPVTPEQQLLLRYTTDGSESTASIYIARDQEEWKWVHLCFR